MSRVRGGAIKATDHDVTICTLLSDPHFPKVMLAALARKSVIGAMARTQAPVPARSRVEELQETRARGEDAITGRRISVVTLDATTAAVDAQIAATAARQRQVDADLAALPERLRRVRADWRSSQHR